MALDAGRRSALLGAKLGALVQAEWDPTDPVVSTFPGGAAQRADGTGWVLVDDHPERGLGVALAWAHQQGLDELHLLVEHAAGILARRACAFRRVPQVWEIHGRSLTRAEPAPFEAPLVPPPGAEEAAALLRSAGVEVLVEHGVLRGEVLGLEIARVVNDATGTRLEVGVGRHDREAFAMVHGDLPTAKALESVISTVKSQRRIGARPHPLNRLAAERWLRASVVADPSLVGVAELHPVEGTVERVSLNDHSPAAAVGRDTSGAPVVVVCSTGIDLDLVPAAADARLAQAPEARLILAVPERDAHPITRSMAAALADPAEIITVVGGWRE